MIPANYKVTGIVQQCVNGEWSEHPINAKVFALDAQHAKERVFEDAKQIALDIDEGAIIRWNIPELVSVYSLI